MTEGSLPSFANPPVTEVVLAVSFKPLQGLSGPRIGQLWAEEFATYFPITEEHPPYEPPVENLAGDQLPIRLDLRISEAFPKARVWFLNNESDELVQVQQNYFACNWRKVHPGAEYDRWDSRESAFRKWLDVLRSFLSKHSLGMVEPTQCEVTYVNHIETGGKYGLADAPRIFRLIGSPSLAESGFSENLEQVQISTKYRLEAGDQAFGRLHIDLRPGYLRAGGRPVYQLQLTARGKPFDGSEGVSRFLNIGHESIVKTFTAVTSPEMHKLWGRQR